MVAALRLLALPLCGALVYAVVIPGIEGFSAVSLLTGLLSGFIVSMLVGLPLLLLGDRFFPGFKARHVCCSLLQGLLLPIFFGRLMIVTVVGGLALGLLYTAVTRAVEMYAAKSQVPQMSTVYVLGIPLCGALPLGIVGSWAISDGTSMVYSFCFFFLVGAGLSMLVGWPVLWLIERLLTTRFRYVIGGVISGFLIWLLFDTPGFPPASVVQDMNELLYQIKYGVLLFISLGCLSGLLFTGFHWGYSVLESRKR